MSEDKYQVGRIEQLTESRFSGTIEALWEMQQSPYYAVRRSILMGSEEAIRQLEQENAKLRGLLSEARELLRHSRDRNGGCGQMCAACLVEAQIEEILGEG